MKKLSHRNTKNSWKKKFYKNYKKEFERSTLSEQIEKLKGFISITNDPSKRQELLTQIRKLKQKRSAMLRNFSGAKRNLMPRSYKPGGTTIYKRTTFISTPMGGQPKKR